jgi:hypothetical protein
MPAKDIRRQSPDAQPDNYIRPGVVDNSLGTALEGLGKVAMQYDVDRSKAKFGEALETLRSEYLTSNPVSANMQDAAAGEGVDDGDESDFVPTEQDNRALKHFSEVLDRDNKSVEQGLMSNDFFRLKAERLYRIAISKRPGLAREYRALAQDLIGFDVVGSSLDIQARKEAELMRSVADRAKTEAELAIAHEKNLREQLTKEGFTEHTLIALGDPKFNEHYRTVFPYYQQRVQARVTKELAEQQVAISDASNKVNLPANTAAYVADANMGLSDAVVGAENILTTLTQAGQDANPATIRGALLQATQMLDNKIVQLESAGSGGKVEPAVVARTMQRYEDLRTRLVDIYEGRSDKEVLENGLTRIKALKSLSLLEDNEFLTMSVLLKEFPGEAAPLMLQKMEKQTALLAARLIQKEATAEEAARNSATLTGQIIAAVWPRGGAGTPSDPQAVGGAHKLLMAGAESFYTMTDDSEFRLEHFTGSVGKPGLMQTLSLHLGTLQKGMSQEQKQELGAALAAGTANAVRVMGASLFTEAPDLKGKVSFDFSPEDGQVFRQKPGVVLNARDAQVMAKYNRAMNTPLIGRVVGGLLGTDQNAAWEAVREMYAPMMESRASRKAQEARRGAVGGGGGTGVAGGGTKGPSERWWDDGGEQ